jgi:hypothetical protein
MLSSPDDAVCSAPCRRKIAVVTFLIDRTCGQHTPLRAAQLLRPRRRNSLRGAGDETRWHAIFECRKLPASQSEPRGVRHGKNRGRSVWKFLPRPASRRVYGIVGDSLNGLSDAIRPGEIEWVHVRHKEVATFAAGTEAHLTGDLEQKSTGVKTQTTRRWPRPPAWAGSGSKTRAKVEGGDWRWRRGSLFTTVKAVMSSRGDELIARVQTNLWR